MRIGHFIMQSLLAVCRGLNDIFLLCEEVHSGYIPKLIFLSLRSNRRVFMQEWTVSYQIHALVNHGVHLPLTESVHFVLSSELHTYSNVLEVNAQTTKMR